MMASMGQMYLHAKEDPIRAQTRQKARRKPKVEFINHRTGDYADLEFWDIPEPARRG